LPQQNKLQQKYHIKIKATGSSRTTAPKQPKIKDRNRPGSRRSELKSRKNLKVEQTPSNNTQNQLQPQGILIQHRGRKLHLSIRTLQDNYAVIPKVTHLTITNNTADQTKQHKG